MGMESQIRVASMGLAAVVSAVLSIASEPLEVIRAEPATPAGWLRLEGRRLTVEGAEAVRIEPAAERAGGWPIAMGWVVGTRDEPIVFELDYGGMYTVWALSFADDPLDPHRAYMVEEILVEPATRPQRIAQLVQTMRDAQAEFDQAESELLDLAPSGQELAEALRTLNDR